MSKIRISTAIRILSKRCSLLVKVLEHGAWLLLARADVAILVDIDKALGLELFNQTLRALVLLDQVVVVGDLGFELSNSGKLCLVFSILLSLCFLLFLDLLTSSATLAADLQEMC